MMKSRLTKAESRLRERLHGDTPTVAMMTDDQLAECIGGPGTRAVDLTDQELEALSAGE